MSRTLRHPPRIVSRAVQRLWSFVPSHVRDGPVDGLPITITAHPIEMRGVGEAEYWEHLVQGFKVTLRVLVKNYIRRSGNIARMTDAQINSLPIYVHPTDIDQGNQFQVQLGRTTLRDLTIDLIRQLFDVSQSDRDRDIFDIYWALVLNPLTLIGATVVGRAATTPPSWLGKTDYLNTWVSKN